MSILSLARRYPLLVLLFSISSGFGELPYEIYKKDVNLSPIQPGSVRESFQIGGFKLSMNLLKFGYTVYAKPVDNILGKLEGESSTIKVMRLPRTRLSLEQVALQLSSQPNSHVTITPIRNNYGLKGVRATSGGKPSLFSNKITQVRYFFVNPSGETICFAGSSKSPNPDWSYFNFLMMERLQPVLK